MKLNNRLLHWYS